MRDEDSDFSSLKTVSTFDKGNNTTVAVDLTSNNLHRFSPPSLFVESLLEQLCKLVEKDPRSQRNLYLTICQKLHQMNLIDESYQLEEFQYMRSHYQKALYHFLTVAKSTSVESKAIYPSTSSQLSLTSANILEWSRYTTEFQELQFIAKGGFGHVYKAKHKLDGEIYAIKKMFLRCHSMSAFLQNLREVKTLAKLNHPNIVSYKAAWLEPNRERERPVAAIVEAKTETSNGSSLEIVFEKSPNKSSESDEKSSSEYSNGRSNEGVLCKYNKSTYRFQLQQPQVGITQCATLYIQMQLCSTTLRDWLDERNQSLTPVNVTQCIDIFKQVVRGVEYIHSQGIVHHDIKPSNIFVSNDLKQVQVGDFGLSCCLLAHSNPALSVVYMSHQPGQYGTKLYAAPEQLKDICHPKSDVYSLGIILLELVEPFRTAMERSKVISELKLGHIPKSIAGSWPHLARIISESVTTNYKKRPTASQLLEILEKTENLSSLQIIEQQAATIKQLQEENASLRERLRELMARHPTEPNLSVES